MFYNNVKSKQSEVTNFDKEPCLVNPLYQYRTLGEMVALYKLSGEFPSVGMRNGVYYASDIEAEIPTTRDKFEDIERLRSNIDETDSIERETEKKIKAANDEEQKAINDELARLKQEQKESAAG